MNDKKRWFHREGSETVHVGLSALWHETEVQVLPLSAVVVEEGSREWAIVMAMKGASVANRAAKYSPCSVVYIAEHDGWPTGWYLMDSPKPGAKEDVAAPSANVAAAMDWAERDGQHETFIGSRVRTLLDEVRRRLRAIVEAKPPVTDLLTPEEREAVETWLRPGSTMWYGDRKQALKLIAALDRIAPAPAPEWRPEKGETVRWTYYGHSGTASYEDGWPERPRVCLPSCLPFYVDSVSPLEEP